MFFMEKKIKKHGMTTEKARRVKQRGHKKEFLYATLIKGDVVKGTKKEDVKDIKGKIHSLKGGSEIQKKSGRHGKWQIFLYKKSRFEQEITFPGREIILEILNTFPNTHEEYEDNKVEVKEKVKKPMIELKEFLLNDKDRFDFFNKSFFDERVDFFVIYDDEAFYVFDREETINTFVKFLEVDNNSTLQKVVFKYNNRLIAEFEYRTTDDGKYPAILFNMQKRPAFDLLTEKISEKKRFNPVLIAYGNAIKYFEDYPI